MYIIKNVPEHLFDEINTMQYQIIFDRFFSI